MAAASDSSACPRPKLSIVIPVYDERANLWPGYVELTEVLAMELPEEHRPYEIIYVDDGSTDGSLDELRRIKAADPRVMIIRLIRNFGQTGAIACGFDHARGALVATMDADLQNDPRDLSLLLRAITEGAEIACGRRSSRTDLRKYPTGLANWITSRVAGLATHDSAFPLRVFRRHVIENLRLSGQMHRFLAVYASWWGANVVVEVPVTHRTRRYGHSKYGLERILKLVPDLILMKYLERYAGRPMHLFGVVGFLFATLGLGILGWAAVETLRAVPRNDPSGGWIITGLALVTSGIVCTFLGLIAETLLRVYYELLRANPRYDGSRSWPLYVVKDIEGG